MSEHEQQSNDHYHTNQYVRNLQKEYYQQNNTNTRCQMPVYCDTNYPIIQKSNKSKYIWSSVKWVGGFFLIYITTLVFIVFAVAFIYGMILALVNHPISIVTQVFDNKNFIEAIISITALILMFIYISYILLYKQCIKVEKIYKKPEINTLITSSGLTFLISLGVRLLAIFPLYFLMMLMRNYLSIDEILNAISIEKQNYLPSIISSVLCAPIYEEIVFRYGLQKNLDKIYPKSSVLLTSIIFSAAHLNPASFVPILIMSLYMGYIYKKTDNLLYPTAIHMVFNITAIIAQYIISVLF